MWNMLTSMHILTNLDFYIFRNLLGQWHNYSFHVYTRFIRLASGVCEEWLSLSVCVQHSHSLWDKPICFWMWHHLNCFHEGYIFVHSVWVPLVFSLNVPLSGHGIFVLRVALEKHINIYINVLSKVQITQVDYEIVDNRSEAHQSN